MNRLAVISVLASGGEAPWQTRLQQRGCPSIKATPGGKSINKEQATTLRLYLPVHVTLYRAKCRFARLSISNSTQSLIAHHLTLGHKQTGSLNKTREGKQTPLYN